MNLSWKKCKSSDFVSYLVYRGDFEGELICTTPDINFIDSSYVGQSCLFHVYVKKKDGYTIDWGSLFLSKNLSTIHLEINDNNEYYFRWNKNPYYNAVSKFTFKLGQSTWESTVLNDTIFKTRLNFNDYCDFSISVIPKIPSKKYQQELSNYKTSFSDKAGICVRITSYWYYPLTQISKDVVACYYNDSIQKFQLSTLKFQSKQAVKYSVSKISGATLSPHGKFMIGGADFPNSVAVNLETNQFYPFIEDESFTGGISQSLHISDIGTGIIIGQDGFESAFESVYDYINKNGSAYHFSQYTALVTLISPDGQFYISDGNFFGKNLGYISYLSGRYEFSSVDSNKLMVLNNSKISIYQCYPFTKLREFDMQDIVFNIDYYNNEILCGSTKLLRIRSLIDGSVIKEIPMTNTPQSWEEYFLYNHVIIWSNQYAYQVK